MDMAETSLVRHPLTGMSIRLFMAALAATKRGL
jgi:hypothetical protein